MCVCVYLCVIQELEVLSGETRTHRKRERERERERMFASMLATAAGTRAELAAECSGARARVASAATSLSEELSRGVTDTVRECFERQRKLEMASKAVRREAEEMNKQVRV